MVQLQEVFSRLGIKLFLFFAGLKPLVVFFFGLVECVEFSFSVDEVGGKGGKGVLQCGGVFKASESCMRVTDGFLVCLDEVELGDLLPKCADAFAEFVLLLLLFLLLL